jgi:hypothetical protein
MQNIWIKINRNITDETEEKTWRKLEGELLEGKDKEQRP